MKKFLPALLLLLPFTMNAQTSCGNRDLDDSTFTNWTGAIGDNNGGLTVPIVWTAGIFTTGNNAVTSDMNARHTIITQNVPDLITGLPTLAPNGGVACVRLGGTTPNYQSEKLTYQFTVTAADTFFQYQYATVLNDGGHPLDQQPYFMVVFRDQLGNIIAAGTDTITAADPTVPFITNVVGMMYTNWTPMSASLSAYLGQQVSVEFISAGCSQSGHFSYTYVDVSCLGSGINNVWPGDCNYDLQADNTDLLNIALAYGATGTTRASASNTWVAQPSTDWGQHFPLGADYKHSDCNGDGVVDANDTLAVVLNYSQTHPFRHGNPDATQSLPPLYLVPVQTTVGPYSYVDVDVYVGTTAIPIGNFTGIVFDVTYDNSLVQPASFSSDFSGSMLGTKNVDMLTLAYNNHAQGDAGFALCKTNLGHASGNGYLGRFRIATQGVTVVTQLNLAIANAYAIDSAMIRVPIGTLGATVTIDPQLPAGIAAPATNDHFSFYPNPANGSVTVNTAAAVQTITITDALGREVYRTQVTGRQTIIDLGGFAPGMYSMNVISENGVASQPLMVTE